MATQLALLNKPEPSSDMRGQLKSARDVLTYMLAGNATFTIRSKVTDTRYTYKVRGADNKNGLWYVSLLHGPDNGNDFAYMGVLDEKPLGKAPAFRHTSKSRFTSSAPSSIAFAWLYDKVCKDLLPSSVAVYHEGRCGRCGRKLTVPESVERGIGPECAERMM